jgi:oligoribonuclease NrnB/cAMP/cGMP phosphodiesterase (DHH superfamily)
MIPLEKLRSLKRAYVHASCPDGVASALVLKDALPDLEIMFVKYDTEEHKSIEPTPDTIFCDFSPWLPKEIGPIRDNLIAQWRSVGVVVLDHHSRDIVEPYGELGVFGDNAKLECGAMLAYREVWEHVRERDSRRMHRFAHLAAIRDTWKKDDPDWEIACRQAAELMFWRFEELAIEEMDESLGARLMEKQIELAETRIKEAQVFTSDKGTRVLMFQGVSATSDAAELLGDKADLIVGFHYRMDGGELKLQLSTRSHTGFDCQALAQAHGGNGHTAAAGFTVAKDLGTNPYAFFAVLLRRWEAL